ncbi:LysE/ArgO family amino acid transporter [Pandoraea norimbergensis]|uniref:Lysine transporter LysE n=1 Tax=Pandoraea norimbergensis TaxID=93219 RepID=A0ABN4JKD8_9BURK|nr:LysE family transporter [Pandoraea norimbergensis]ALS61145.1 lysine transporter LysE [Pandoraea norimbergensis]
MSDTSVFTEGLLLGLGLFTSVGPKDAFVIRRSVTGQHLLLIVLICAGSDALLIALGTGGLAALLTRTPIVLSLALWGGIGYLVCHGLLALRSAVRGKHNAEDGGGSQRYSLRQTLLGTAAVSLLNPYAWVDTVLVIGAITASKSADARWPFTVGAVAASFAWFFFLTYVSYACRWLFSRSIAWRALDGFVAVMMFGIAAHLATGHF